MRAERLETLAAGFWERAGGPAAFPRDLARAIPLAVPVGLVRLEGLRPTAVRRWFLRAGLRLPLDVRDRPLDGCVVAYRGQAVIFTAAGLGAGEERVVLAHELGHFLADYERPRRQALDRLGPSVLPVLDGERPVTAAEDLAGVLAGVPLAAHAHYMERGFDPLRAWATDRVERTATELGSELVAPARDVVARGRARRLPSEPGPWEGFLAEEFGLPESWAKLYAGRLLRRLGRQRTFTDLLGL
jgi:hypothetical protein